MVWLNAKPEETHHDAFMRLGGKYCYAVPHRIIHLFPNHNEEWIESPHPTEFKSPWDRVPAICGVTAYRSHIKKYDDAGQAYLKGTRLSFCQNCMRTGVRQ